MKQAPALLGWSLWRIIADTMSQTVRLARHILHTAYGMRAAALYCGGYEGPALLLAHAHVHACMQVNGPGPFVTGAEPCWVDLYIFTNTAFLTSASPFLGGGWMRVCGGACSCCCVHVHVHAPTCCMHAWAGHVPSRWCGVWSCWVTAHHLDSCHLPC